MKEGIIIKKIISLAVIIAFCINMFFVPNTAYAEENVITYSGSTTAS